MFGSIEPSQEISELKWFDIKWIRDTWYDLSNTHISSPGMVKEHQELMKVLILNELGK
jgi:hypothetical protein